MFGRISDSMLPWWLRKKCRVVQRKKERTTTNVRRGEQDRVLSVFTTNTSVSKPYPEQIKKRQHTLCHIRWQSSLLLDMASQRRRTTARPTASSQPPMAPSTTQKHRRASTTGSTQPAAKRTQQDNSPADNSNPPFLPLLPPPSLPLLPQPTIKIPPLSRPYNLRPTKNPNPANSAGLHARTRVKIAATAAAKKPAKAKNTTERALVAEEQTQQEDGIVAGAKPMNQREAEDKDRDLQVNKGIPSDDEEEFQPETHIPTPEQEGW